MLPPTTFKSMDAANAASEKLKADIMAARTFVENLLLIENTNLP